MTTHRTHRSPIREIVEDRLEGAGSSLAIEVARADTLTAAAAEITRISGVLVSRQILARWLR